FARHCHVKRDGRNKSGHDTTADVTTGLDPVVHVELPYGLPDQVFSPETSPTGVRGHDRHIMMHGIGFQGGLPCRGARCRRWTSGVSLSGWRGRKERTGASCAGGSGFMLTPATSGLVVG